MIQMTAQIPSISTEHVDYKNTLSFRITPKIAYKRSIERLRSILSRQQGSTHVPPHMCRGTIFVVTIRVFGIVWILRWRCKGLHQP